MPAYLITFFKSILVLFTFSLVISGCSGKSDNEEAIIKALEESLEGSNKSINLSSATILKSLEDKSWDYATKERADIWYPKAQQIMKLSSQIFSCIGELKKAKGVSSEKAKELFAVLNKYKEDILNVDSSIRYEFAKSIMLISKDFDSQTLNEKDFYNSFFNIASQASTSAILSKFQNNIKVIENKITAFCDTKVVDNSFRFPSYSAIVGQNSTYVKGGEEIKITAGIGAYSKASLPVININGRKIEVGEEGFATYKIKTSRKAGDYNIPVEISFKNPLTGKDEIKTVYVEYTVAKQCDQ